MYTLFIQKKRGDISPFPLTKQLNDFLITTQATGIIISPGYLSQTTAKTKEILDTILDGTKVKLFGLLNCTGTNTIAMHETYLFGKGILLKIKRNKKNDHRKMVFVFKYKDISISEVNSINYKSFLGEIEVIGVAIGSSNFSYTTYIGSMIVKMIKGISVIKKRDIADKGEADILMFEDDDFKKILLQISENPNEKLVLSKSITSVPDEFLKNILRNTFEHTLV